MRFSFLLSSALSVFVGMSVAVNSASSQDFGAAANGNWSNPTTWTPAGGPPGSGQRAFIGSTQPTGSASTAEVTLTGDVTVLDLHLGQNAGTDGTLNLGGNTLTVEDELWIGIFGGVGTINHGGGNIDSFSLRVARGNNFTFGASDETENLSATIGSMVATTSVGNVSTDVDIFDTSQLTLGADLLLSQDLEVRGPAGMPSTVEANGNNITARDIFIGRFSQEGLLLNDGVITANRDLEVSVGTFALDADDSVSNQVAARDGGTLTLHANTAAMRALVTSNATLNTVATGNVTVGARVEGTSGLLDLGTDLILSEDLEVRGPAGMPSTVDANGNDITARDIFIGRFNQEGVLLNDGVITANRDLNVSVGTFTLDANDSVTHQVAARDGATVTLHANTAAMRALVTSNATLNTVATGNVTVGARVEGTSGLLDLGTDLILSEDLEVRGPAGMPSTVEANGNDITARDIFIGRFNQEGRLLNDGVITANRDLNVSVGTFTLDANDSVAHQVAAIDGGTLTLHANTAAMRALVASNATLNTVATGNVTVGARVEGTSGLLDLGADLILSEDLEVRGPAGMPSTVDANGNDITARDVFIGRFGQEGLILNDGAITANRDLHVDVGTFALDANDSVANAVFVHTGGTLTLHANTVAVGAVVGTDATLNTVATSNITDSVVLSAPGALVNLGAPLQLTGPLDIFGQSTTAATVDAQGHDVTVNDAFVGHFTQRGALVNSGRLTVMRNLDIENSLLELDGGLDSVGQALLLDLDSTLAVNQDADGVRGLSLEGSTLSILDTSVIELSFDGNLSTVADWIFRWAGDRVTEINDLIASGKIVVNAAHPFIVTNNGDGYTYIANFEGDFDADNQVDCTDIDLLTAAVAGGSVDLTFDLTGDGIVNLADRDAWLAGAGAAFLDSGNPYLIGDANLDGVVDGVDFIVWNQNKFSATPAWCSGDFNADGVVDGSDFILWNQNKFQAADAAAVHVPEVGVSWLFLGLCLVAIRSQRLANGC